MDTSALKFVGNAIGNLTFQKAYLRIKDPKTDKYTNPESWGSRRMTVQYNPAKLRISTRAGSFQQPVVGSAITTYNQITIPAQTVLDVELIIEDINNQDAFMLDKFTDFSATAIIDDVSNVAAAIMGREYSVRKTVEGILGLMMDPYTRQIVFCWSDMTFKGELTSVSATYTMFNPIGNPICAKVHLSIQQNNPTDDIVAYWEDAFDRRFLDPMVANMLKQVTDTVGAAQNWVNI